MSEFKCPFCGGRLYRSSRRGKQVYKCNDLNRTGVDCPSGHEAVGRTKAQVRRAFAVFNDILVADGCSGGEGGGE